MWGEVLRLIREAHLSGSWACRGLAPQLFIPPGMLTMPALRALPTLRCQERGFHVPLGDGKGERVPQQTPGVKGAGPHSWFSTRHWELLQPPCIF